MLFIVQVVTACFNVNRPAFVRMFSTTTLTQSGEETDQTMSVFHNKAISTVQFLGFIIPKRAHNFQAQSYVSQQSLRDPIRSQIRPHRKKSGLEKVRVSQNSRASENSQNIRERPSGRVKFLLSKVTWLSKRDASRMIVRKAYHLHHPLVFEFFP